MEKDEWLTTGLLDYKTGPRTLYWSPVSICLGPWFLLFLIEWAFFFFCHFIDNHKLPGTIQDINKEPLLLSAAELWSKVEDFCSGWTLPLLIRWDTEKQTWHQIEDGKDFSGISQDSDAPSVRMEDKH